MVVTKNLYGAISTAPSGSLYASIIATKKILCANIYLLVLLSRHPKIHIFSSLVSFILEKFF